MLLNVSLQGSSLRLIDLSKGSQYKEIHMVQYLPPCVGMNELEFSGADTFFGTKASNVESAPTSFENQRFLHERLRSLGEEPHDASTSNSSGESEPSAMTIHKSILTREPTSDDGLVWLEDATPSSSQKDLYRKCQQFIYADLVNEMARSTYTYIKTAETIDNLLHRLMVPDPPHLIPWMRFPPRNDRSTKACTALKPFSRDKLRCPDKYQHKLDRLSGANELLRQACATFNTITSEIFQWNNVLKEGLTEPTPRIRDMQRECDDKRRQAFALINHYPALTRMVTELNDGPGAELKAFLDRPRLWQPGDVDGELHSRLEALLSELSSSDGEPKDPVNMSLEDFGVESGGEN